jgi:DNA-binding MarR family transcriptional regulator
MSEITLFEFADELNEIFPVIMKEFTRRMSKEFVKTKITLPQFLILHFLFQEGASKMTALARFVNVSTAAMTGIVDRLLKSGYVSREHNPLDRRIVKVKLTAKGSEFFKKVNQERRRMMISIFSKISERDRSDYLRILTQIKEILMRESSSKR